MAYPAAPAPLMTQRIWEMSNVWTDAGLNVQTAKARLAEMENQLAKTGAQIAELAGKEGKLVTVRGTSIEKVMEYEEANRLARAETEKLLEQITKIALVSPFETEDVEAIAQMAVQSKMATGEIEGFTKAFLDYSAAHDIVGAKMRETSYFFLELARQGKITQLDMR